MSHQGLCEVRFSLEGDEFKLPENEVIVDIESRDIRHHVVETSHSTTIDNVPPYLTTCYDELSREFCSYSVAEMSPSHVPLVSYSNVVGAVGGATFPEEVGAAHPNQAAAIGKRFLQHYHPCYPSWQSTFKHSPPDSRHLLAPGPKALTTDSHLLVELAPALHMKVEFEPLFGSMALYMFEGDRCHRLSESFHFSCTSPTVRQRYKDVYRFSEDDLPPEVRREMPEVFTPPNLCMFTIPDELKRRDVFLVIQLGKVLTADAEKAIAPYQRSSSVPPVPKHVEACRRLYPFRQPVGFAVLKLFEMDSRASRRQVPLKFNFLAMKATFSEGQIGQLIRDLYPPEGTTSHARVEQLDIAMTIRLHDLGQESQLSETLSRVPGMVDPVHGTMNGRLLPSQFQGKEASELYSDSYELGVLNGYFKRGAVVRQSAAGLGEGQTQVALPIRHIALLLPPTPTLRAATDPMRQLKTAIDNTLYVYPIVFERFQQRNLCAKIQVPASVPFSSPFSPSPSPLLFSPPLSFFLLPSHFSFSPLFFPSSLPSSPPLSLLITFRALPLSPHRFMSPLLFPSPLSFFLDI